MGFTPLDLSVARDQARVSVVQAWAQLEASKSSIESTRNQVKSAEAALNGTALAPEAETGFSHIFVIDRDGTEIRRRRYLRVLSIPLHPSQHVSREQICASRGEDACSNCSRPIGNRRRVRCARTRWY